MENPANIVMTVFHGKYADTGRLLFTIPVLSLTLGLGLRFDLILGLTLGLCLGLGLGLRFDLISILTLGLSVLGIPLDR